MTLLRTAAVAVLAGAALAFGAGAAAAAPTPAPVPGECPPGYLEHPFEGCIPIPPGPNG